MFSSSVFFASAILMLLMLKERVAWVVYKVLGSEVRVMVRRTDMLSVLMSMRFLEIKCVGGVECGLG